MVKGKTVKIVAASLFVLLSIVAVVALRRYAVGPMSASDSSTAIASGNYSHTVNTADGTREYVVHVPEGFDASNTYPVLLAFHGGFGNAEQFERSSGLSEVADERDFVVVYGQGLSFGRLQAPVWNAGACCGQAQENRRDIDDVAYVRAVVEDVRKRYSIDESRVYGTGMSNGAMLTQRLACEASDLLAGAASVAGTIAISDCDPERPIPILVIHGTDDENVPYAGGTGSEAFNRTSYISVEQEFHDWAKRNRCGVGEPTVTQVAPPSTDGKSVERRAYSGCAAPVELYTIYGGVHEWPGGQTPTGNRLERTQPTQILDASRVIADFFGL